MSDARDGRAATVVVPTHDHGPLLRLSAASALRQTVQDFELFIVGDGATDETREAAAELAAGDERVRFFDLPKGERLGEAHRHAVLAEARGRIVLYLADDDLWLPDHVERMDDALREAEFACTQTAYVWPDATLYLYPVDLARPRQRALHCAEPDRENRVPLAAGGHTLAAYRSLPGWSPAPPDFWSDLHFFRQFLTAPWVRAASTTAPTLLKFHSPQRRAMTPGERLAELTAWSERVADPSWVAALPATLLGPARDAALRLEDAAAWHLDRERARTGELTAALEAAAAQAQDRTGEHDALQREHASLRAELADAHAQLAAERQRAETDRAALAGRADAAERALRDIRSTRVWRARDLALRLSRLDRRGPRAR